MIIRWTGGKGTMAKKKRKPAPGGLGNLATDEERRDYVVRAADEQIDFYQLEVSKYAFWYSALTVIALIGSALTPLLVILLESRTNVGKFWIALPSGIAGLAVAINSAFRLREEWAQSYYTLSALLNEKDRFIVRASPDYSADESLSLAIDRFQANVSEFVMSEVTLWRRAMTQSSKEEKK
jgi:hypothetical protein